jgi:hypothetical protein
MKTTFMPAQRDPGVLAHGGLLTGHATASSSSPVRRGKLVRTRLLCLDIPDPPGDIDTMLKPPVGAVTTRDRFVQHSKDPGCAACHKLIDPLGFAFEGYDGFGRRREKEGNLTVDTRGSYTTTKGEMVAFNGLRELSAHLGKSDDVKACLARHWAYDAFGVWQWPGDECTYSAIAQEAAKSDFSLKSVVMAIIHAPTFTRRAKDN